MPLLRLQDTFSSQVLEFTEGGGAKAGLLEFLVRINPDLKKYILPGVHIPFDQITAGKIIDILESQGRGVDENVYRSTHKDDAIAYIGGIDNLNPSSEIYRINLLEDEIAKMKKVLVSPEEKGERLKVARNEYERKHEEAKKVYPFLFALVERVVDDWGLQEVPMFSINSMLIHHLEGYVRVLENKETDIYDGESIYGEGEDIHMYSDVRMGYTYNRDSEVQEFSKYFHEKAYTKELDANIRTYINGKSKQEIGEIIIDLQARNIPQYYDDYVTREEVDRMLVDSYYTQDQIDETQGEVNKLRNENLGKTFLLKGEILEKYIEENNLRGLDETGLYIQEKLGDDWNFGTMLEHPHIPGRFLFSGRGGDRGDAHPSYYTVGGESYEGTVSFPMEKLTLLYNEVIKTGLLCDDISLQVEIAARGNEVYILQIRAFRKRETADWYIDDMSSQSGLENVFGITPEEGLIVHAGEGDFFRAHGQRSSHPLELQKLKFAASNCIAPFDHELTEVAYYPEIAVFGARVDQALIQDGEYRVYSNGVGYKIDILD